MRMVLFVFLLFAAPLAWAQSPSEQAYVAARVQSGCRFGREGQIGRRFRQDEAGRRRLVRRATTRRKAISKRSCGASWGRPRAQGLFRCRHIQPRRAVLRGGRRHARRHPVLERQRQRARDDGEPPAAVAGRAQELVEGRSPGDGSQNCFQSEPSIPRPSPPTRPLASLRRSRSMRRPAPAWPSRSLRSSAMALAPCPCISLSPSSKAEGSSSRWSTRRSRQRTRGRAARRLRCRLEGLSRPIQSSRCGLRSGEGDVESVRAPHGRGPPRDRGRRGRGQMPEEPHQRRCGLSRPHATGPGSRGRPGRGLISGASAGPRRHATSGVVEQSSSTEEVCTKWPSISSATASRSSPPPATSPRRRRSSGR